MDYEKKHLVEIELDWCKDITGADPEGMLRTGECSVGHILIVPFVKEIVGGKRKTHFAAYVPYGWCVKQHKVIDIAFRKFW